MQNWKLINDSAQLAGVQGEDSAISDRGTVIPDSGFASFAHPKLNFNFTMRATFRVPVGNDLVIGSGSMQLLDLPLKSATRPQPTFNMVDVNYYNYRTKVATKTDFGTASVVMYDDSDGKAHAIYKTYMNSLSPITKVTDDTLIHNPMSAPFGQMSSIGALPNNPNGIIKTLSVYHFYVNRGRTLRTEYKYINPKIQTFELDELSMTESAVSTMTMTFAYDGVTTEDTVVGG